MSVVIALRDNKKETPGISALIALAARRMWRSRPLAAHSTTMRHSLMCCARASPRIRRGTSGQRGFYDGVRGLWIQISPACSQSVRCAGAAMQGLVCTCAAEGCQVPCSSESAKCARTRVRSLSRSLRSLCSCPRTSSTNLRMLHPHHCPGASMPWKASSTRRPRWVRSALGTRTRRRSQRRRRRKWKRRARTRSSTSTRL